MKIVELTTLDEVRALEGLLADYIRHISISLKDHAGLTFDEAGLMVSTLHGLSKVIPPNGRTFIAKDDGGKRIGMIFLRQSGPDAMEIKRLYVMSEARGTGAGRALVLKCLDAASEAGATSLRLDTAKSLTVAIGLYEALGFEYRDPYAENDHADDTDLLPYLVFMEKALYDRRARASNMCDCAFRVERNRPGRAVH